MEKEEILARSRQEKPDEGTEYARSKGAALGMAGMCLMFLCLILFNLFNGISSHALMAMFWAYLGLESLGQYRVTGQKLLLTGAVLGILAGILSALCHIQEVLE